MNWYTKKRFFVTATDNCAVHSPCGWTSIQDEVHACAKGIFYLLALYGLVSLLIK